MPVPNLGCPLVTTESDLRDWRGSIMAERQCAGVMHVTGYAEVDPPATLGGPDRRKDIVAHHDGRPFSMRH